MVNVHSTVYEQTANKAMFVDFLGWHLNLFHRDNTRFQNNFESGKVAGIFQKPVGKEAAPWPAHQKPEIAVQWKKSGWWKRLKSVIFVQITMRIFITAIAWQRGRAESVPGYVWSPKSKDLAVNPFNPDLQISVNHLKPGIRSGLLHIISNRQSQENQ